VAITTSGSSQAFQFVDHHGATKNCSQPLRDRPAWRWVGSSRLTTIQLGFVHCHFQDRRPISSPSPCVGAHLVLLMNTLLGIHRCDLSRVTKSQLRAPQCFDQLRTHNSRLLRTAAQIRISHWTTQGAKNAQSRIYSRSMPARNGCAEFTPEMPQPTASPAPLPTPVSISRAMRSIFNVRVAG